MTSYRPIRPNDYVSDVTVEIGLALRERLHEKFPGRVRTRLRDNPLTTVPGHTIFVSSAESCASATAPSTAVEASERILPTILRELRHQLEEAGLEEGSQRWSVAYTWDGHGLFDDGQLVEQGFRFDAYVEVFCLRSCCERHWSSYSPRRQAIVELPVSARPPSCGSAEPVGVVVDDRSA